MPRKVNVQLSLPEKGAARVTWSIGMLCLLVAMVLTAIASISLTISPGIDIARVVNNGTNVTTSGTGDFTQIQFGVWSDCVRDASGNTTCSTVSTTGGLVSLVNSRANATQPLIGLALTRDKILMRGIQMIPLAFLAVFLAILFSVIQINWILTTSVVITIAATAFTLCALASDIRLFLLVKAKAQELGFIATFGTGLIITAVSAVLLIVACFLMGFNCCAARRESKEISSATVMRDSGV